MWFEGSQGSFLDLLEHRVNEMVGPPQSVKAGNVVY